MKLTLLLLTTLSLVLPVAAQESSKVTPGLESEVMLAAVSRDGALLSGGIGSGPRTKAGSAAVEPLARLSAAGKFSKLPCENNEPKRCRQFARQYLSKSRVYTVISSDGYGATVNARPTTLSECFDFTGKATYSGAQLEGSAIAASSPVLFAEAPPLTPLDKVKTSEIGKLLKAAMVQKLDSAKHLRAWSLELAGQSLILVQRAFGDIPDAMNERTSLVFAIGMIDGKRMRVLHWKQNTDDEDERVLGTVKLNTGQEFLLSVVSDPEGHFYRVYGIEHGRLKLVYQGGGSSC